MRQYFNNYLVGAISALISFQSHAQVVGTITDSKTGSPLAGVEVFVNHTTVGSQSDNTGYFALENTPAGFHEIVLYKKGYVLFRSTMKISSDRSYNLKLSLTPSKKQKSTHLTETELNALKNELTYKSNEGSMLEIVNAKEITFSKIEEKRIPHAPLMIENNATGYRLFYYGMEKSLQEISDAPVKYEPLLTPDVKQSILWEKNRKEYFQGSQRHWLMSLINNQTKEQGYSLQDEKGNEVNVSSLFSISSLAGYSKLTISKPLIIQYKMSNGAIQTSRAETNDPVDMNRFGLLINPKALIIKGDMAKIGLADRLPIDYQPVAGDVENVYTKTIERSYEKIYVQTDKPYYYPGETIWLKGYINYKEPTWRDSLSKVMYVELIDSKRKLALAKTLKIDSGTFYNEFILSDTLNAGAYYLRAYTNLVRNFGDSTLFVKSIPVLHATDKVESPQEKIDEMVNPQLTIASDKKKYKSREKITLTLNTKEKKGNPVASNLSISVTDATQVVPVEELVTIANGFPLETKKQNGTLELNYPVEYGVTHRGIFLGDNGKPEQTTITVLQPKPRNLMMVTSDEQGIFSMTGLNFYDTALFAFKSDKAKNSPYGKVQILPRELPAMNFKDIGFNLITKRTESSQRIISDYERENDSKLLKTLEVRASRIPDEYQKDYRTKRSYGFPDYVLKEKDINTGYGNLAYALVGKVPGLVVQPEASSIKFSRAGTQSINFGSGPMVTVNDVPVGGDAYDIISNINPSSVESIEFTKRINVLYGSQGANGVIAVYTKKGVSEDDLGTKSNFQTIKISGYASPRKFRSPDYENKKTDPNKVDYRSTIYWNPNVTTNGVTKTATVSFFAADLPAQYRVVVEGVTQNGEPLRAVYFVAVDR